MSSNTNLVLETPEVLEDKKSLLESAQESLLPGSSEEKENESLIGDTSSPTVVEADVESETEKQAKDLEHRKEFYSKPEHQATILLNNYLASHKNFYPTGHQKRMMYREFLRKAKKGAYKKIFNELIYGISIEDSKKAAEKIKKLN